MCGIAGIILKEGTNSSLISKIQTMSRMLSHRGPDGEGFIVADQQGTTPCFADNQPASVASLSYLPVARLEEKIPDAFLAFAHRRLSIIDLSEAGHQPMCDHEKKRWIIHNGEIYNYRELRNELSALGYRFYSETDTEVVLNAYLAWGCEAPARFNGMWSFCIYDSIKNNCFVSRDRLGVKPFYYVNNGVFFAFASEQKAFIRSGLMRAEINDKALGNYLVNESLETETENFFNGIHELAPGHNLVYEMGSGRLDIKRYYHLSENVSSENDNLDDRSLIARVGESLEHAIKLRMRSDVDIGVCLSGGIDSSALAAVISEKMDKPLPCFTSVFKGQAIDEELFAGIVVKKINGRHFKTEPSVAGFKEELSDLVYSQDVPIWDSSTYAQFKVMQLARDNGIKVVLDGQGADELFGGYHHHFLAYWNSLVKQGNLAYAFGEIRKSAKTINSPFSFYFKEILKRKMNFRKKNLGPILQQEFLNQTIVTDPNPYFEDVNEALIHDIYVSRLKSFLKCEDRCGMWHGVESRTPFSDDPDLLNLMFSFNGNRKIRNGTSKYLLREAMKDKLPAEIYNRFDKKGFETPMQKWVEQLMPQIAGEIMDRKFSFVNNDKLQGLKAGNIQHNRLLFRLFILCRWYSVFKS